MEIVLIVLLSIVSLCFIAFSIKQKIKAFGWLAIIIIFSVIMVCIFDSIKMFGFLGLSIFVSLYYKKNK